jgi:pimeloyl-ACP methyl ester carboxylesterase
MKKLWILAVLALSCTARREPSALERLKPCTAAQGPADAYCGTVSVFEDRDARQGRRIALNVMLLPALKANTAPDPLFILAGGPGQAATEFARLFGDEFRTVERTRDIVLVDQRGTGKSNPLECKSNDGLTSPDAFVERMRTCLASYKDKADVTKYTTDIAMDDLDDVRQFLGYPKIDLYGGSYGTRAALVYARRHAAHTRAVILDGVAPTDMRLPLYFARDSQRALDLLFDDCAKSAACNQRFPNLRQRLAALLDRLKVHPEHITYADPRTGLTRERDIDHATVARAIFGSLYTPLTAAAVPLLVEQAEKGNYTGILTLNAALGPLAESVAQGMHFSIVCSEDVPRIDPQQIDRESAGTFLGRDAADVRLKPCEFWPRAKIDPAYYDNSPSDIPALILSGELDPVTPPRWGELVAAQWKHSKHVIVPATGHGTASAGCVMQLISRFLDTADPSQVDPSCVKQLKRPPFLVGPSGPDAVKP